MSEVKHLTQLNVGTLRDAIDDPRLADFVNSAFSSESAAAAQLWKTARCSTPSGQAA